MLKMKVLLLYQPEILRNHSKPKHSKTEESKPSDNIPVTNFVTVMYVEGVFHNSVRKEEHGNSTQYSHEELLINLAVIHDQSTVSSERSLVKIKPYITTSSLITATCMCFHKQLINQTNFLPLQMRSLRLHPKGSSWCTWLQPV